MVLVVDLNHIVVFVAVNGGVVAVVVVSAFGVLLIANVSKVSVDDVDDDDVFLLRVMALAVVDGSVMDVADGCCSWLCV